MQTSASCLKSRYIDTCMYIYIHICTQIPMRTTLHARAYLCWHISLCPSDCETIDVSTLYLRVYLYIHLSIYPYLYPSMYPSTLHPACILPASIHPSIPPSGRPAVLPSVNPSIHLISLTCPFDVALSVLSSIQYNVIQPNPIHSRLSLVSVI